MGSVANFLKQLVYEGGQLSLTRTLAVLSYLLFAGVSIYLIIYGITWSHYDTFASLTGGGGAATQVVNKLINSKYNSPPEQPPRRDV